ncbi:hypothetical protein PSPO01_10046 [Paraphaeosphaeria sporulosa]
MIRWSVDEGPEYRVRDSPATAQRAAHNRRESTATEKIMTAHAAFEVAATALSASLGSGGVDVCFVVPEPDWTADCPVPCSDPQNGASPRCDGDDWVPGRQGCSCSQVVDVRREGNSSPAYGLQRASVVGNASCARHNSRYAQTFSKGWQRLAAPTVAATTASPTWAQNEDGASLLHTHANSDATEQKGLPSASLSCGRVLEYAASPLVSRRAEDDA